jgi:hypothetical protein
MLHLRTAERDRSGSGRPKWHGNAQLPPRRIGRDNESPRLEGLSTGLIYRSDIKLRSVKEHRSAEKRGAPISTVYT